MQVAIRTLLHMVQNLYPVRLIAGEDGLNRTTQWVSVAERER